MCIGVILAARLIGQIEHEIDQVPNIVGRHAGGLGHAGHLRRINSVV